MCLLSFVVCSCADDDDAVIAPRAVIEGWIDSDGYPKVIFTESFVPGEDNANIVDKIIRWGVVTISDGDKTVIMTGSPDNTVFPPYSYTTYDIYGCPGKTYTIVAEYEGLKATASATMPEAPAIHGIVTEPVHDNDTLRSVTLEIEAPDDCPAYYHVSTRVIPYEHRFYPAIMGCVSASALGSVVKVPVFRGKTSLSSADFVPQLPSNRTVIVRVERVTAAVYAFWQAFNEATLFGGSQFVGHDSSLGGNIGGGYGYWSPQGATTVRLAPTVNGGDNWSKMP